MSEYEVSKRSRFSPIVVDANEVPNEHMHPSFENEIQNIVDIGPTVTFWTEQMSKTHDR